MAAKPLSLFTRLTPSSETLPGQTNCDVLRMRVPGGWLVSTVISANAGGDSLALSHTTVFVPDPDGTWRPANEVPLRSGLEGAA